MLLTFLIVLAIILASFGGVYLYALESEKNALVKKKVSNREVVRLARYHEGKLTPQLLSRSSQLSETEASRKLHLMLYEGVFRYEYDENYLPVFTLSQAVQKAFELPPEIESSISENLNLADNEVIRLALESKGRISAPALCVKAEVPYDCARFALEKLQSKGVFDLQVSENGTIIYILHDLDLLR